MKTQKIRASIDEEIVTDVIQKQVPEIRIVKGKKQRHKRDGCGGGGGGGLATVGLGVGPMLSALFGNPPVDFDIVKAARDIPSGAIIKDKDLEDISALELQQAGVKISKDMATRDMAKNMYAAKVITKGTLLKVNMYTKKVTPIH